MPQTTAPHSAAAPSALGSQPPRHGAALRWAIALVLIGAALNLLYLWNNCPLGLAEDEAHYWEWSRHLDYGYYSKPPGIAWVHFAATTVGGWFGLDVSMPVLRTAAVLFSVLTGLLSLDLARRMFRDNRAALMVTALSAAVPMFVVGALLITIDSPMYLCWAASVYCLWRHIERPGTVRWLYAAGAAAGLGMLFKPVLIAVPLCAAVAAIHPDIRRRLATWHSLPAGLLVLASQIPVVIWNANHGWVTFRHLGGQAGIGQTTRYWYTGLARMGEFVAGQAGGMGGVMFVLLAIAVGLAIASLRRKAPASDHNALPGTAVAFLLAFTLPLWGFYLVLNLWAGTQVNWPAASYFAGMILLAGVATHYWTLSAEGAADPKRAAKDRRAWRTWVPIAITWGILLAMLAQNTHWFYPLVRDRVAADARGTGSKFHPRKWDLSYRLRGHAERATAVHSVADQMQAQTGRAPLIATTRYDTSSSLAFYLPGRPFVHCIMSRVGGRHSQYDLWPDLNERTSGGALVHAGRDVLLVGDVSDDVLAKVISPAFERVDAVEVLPVHYAGMVFREVPIRRCYGFKGFPEGPRGKW